jgi:uncharacterized protein (UPF0332 family)
MPVESSLFVEEAAEYLAAGSDSEIKFRCSISRAYYGLYHTGLEYADTISTPPVSDTAGPSHRKLSAFFENNLDSDMGLRLSHRRLGYSMKQLHEQRISADYKLDHVITREVAESHLVRCNSMIQLVDTLKAAKAA